MPSGLINALSSIFLSNGKSQSETIFVENVEEEEIVVPVWSPKDIEVPGSTLPAMLTL